MSPVRKDSAVGIVPLLTEVYLSVFVLFFQGFASQWSSESNGMKGTTGISVLQILVALIGTLWIQIATHNHVVIKSWVTWLLIGPVWFCNYYFLIVRGDGIAFEKKFPHFSSRKQIFLYVAAAGITVGILVGLLASIDAYHEAFGIPGK